MKNKFSKIQDIQETKIDITPMLDVVFILLIFFIVTATFVKEVGFNLSPTNTDITLLEYNKNLLIDIQAGDKIFIQGRNIDLRRITAIVRRLSALNPDAHVIIKASKRSKNKILVQVIDSVREAEIFEHALAQSTD